MSGFEPWMPPKVTHFNKQSFVSFLNKRVSLADNIIVV